MGHEIHQTTRNPKNNLGRTVSPPLTAENNYVIMRCPTFTLKIAPFPSTISTTI